MEQLVLRSGLYYHFSDQHSILLGYGLFITDERRGELNLYRKENRVFQQYNFYYPFKSWNFLFRVRTEQQFLQDKMQNRLRLFSYFTHPLTFTDKKSRMYIVGYNELFLRINNFGFNQNRSSLGLGYKANKQLKVEISFMRQEFSRLYKNQLQYILYYNF